MADEKLSPAKRVGDGTPGPGRHKGVPNKTTTQLKEALLLAATQAGGEDGLVGYLLKQAKENPGPFMALLGKVLPLQLDVSGRVTVESVTVGFVRAPAVIDAPRTYDA